MSGACSTPIIRFHLSTTKFFVEHLNAQLNYGASADQTAELFTLATPELGQIVFSKEWVFDLAEASNGTATVHYGYYAAVTMPDGEHELLISHFRKMLDWLSILVRQRIVLLGWTIENAGQRIEVYLDPLDKRLTPFMPPKPGRFIVEDDEFTEVALSGLASWPDKNPEEQEQLSDFSYALAPHLDESTEEKFIFQYRMLEKFIITPKVAARTTLIETEILSGFINNLKKAKIENPDSDQASALNKRLDGFINNIQQDKPSLRHKIDGFISSFMKGSVEDLWPIAGTDEKPGLKEIRDTLSHTDTRSIHHQSLAVAQWHLTILLERLVFKLLELPAPVAIQPGSNILRREFWYERAYWENLQKQTLVKQ
ncbi:hypothetical protein ED236_06765 [Pseudomethylobacillus aquaticus]|uniref:ApeA N-terminal domain-containing protein n=2 Tax=Pseudomethylobacillus aquaticus TaxID=2676064 RepID=A0A3N0V0C4_9PROT|nr:hypothetical protein ED236_06765 [Pseudomethylobacillus aquaticus]